VKGGVRESDDIIRYIDTNLRHLRSLEKGEEKYLVKPLSRIVKIKQKAYILKKRGSFDDALLYTTTLIPPIDTSSVLKDTRNKVSFLKLELESCTKCTHRERIHRRASRVVRL
jgi:hypothetical protein